MADTNTEFPTTIGADAVFKGELSFEKGVRILGRFEGEITSEGQLVVAEGATLTGNAKSGSIRIEGKVKGNLTAGAKVQLTSSARVEGDLQTSRLEVAEGAVLIGRCTVGIDGKRAPAETKAASAPAAAVAPARSRTPEPATAKK
jgi:cytoskeletal protein CcmA (bactofilin family)